MPHESLTKRSRGAAHATRGAQRAAWGLGTDSRGCDGAPAGASLRREGRRQNHERGADSFKAPPLRARGHARRTHPSDTAGPSGPAPDAFIAVGGPHKRTRKHSGDRPLADWSGTARRCAACALGGTDFRTAEARLAARGAGGGGARFRRAGPARASTVRQKRRTDLSRRHRPARRAVAPFAARTERRRAGGPVACAWRAQRRAVQNEPGTRRVGLGVQAVEVRACSTAHTPACSCLRQFLCQLTASAMRGAGCRAARCQPSTAPRVRRRRGPRQPAVSEPSKSCTGAARISTAKHV